MYPVMGKDEIKDPSSIECCLADKLSSELHEISENANNLYTNLFLDYTYNDVNHPEQIYYRSDHWNFAKNGIPVIFYTESGHPDYHKPTDTVEKIDFQGVEWATKIAFEMVWNLSVKDEKPVLERPLPTWDSSWDLDHGLMPFENPFRN